MQPRVLSLPIIASMPFANEPSFMTAFARSAVLLFGVPLIETSVLWCASCGSPSQKYFTRELVMKQHLLGNLLQPGFDRIAATGLRGKSEGEIGRRLHSGRGQ